MAEIYALGEIALVTSAASGIGQEVGYLFAESGCRAVVFADLNLEKYEALALKVDVTNLEEVKKMVSETVEKFGRIDYSVNSAGVGNKDRGPASKLDFDHFNKVIEVNLKGTVNCVSVVTAQMKTQAPKTYTPKGLRSSRAGLQARDIGRGSIVNLGSVNSQSTQKGTLAYTASKHGIIGVTKAAAIDHAKDGIRINAVCPGGTDTRMMEAAIKRTPALLQFSIIIPLGERMATTDEVASAIVYLCSPGASYATGCPPLIDAGFTLVAARS